MGRLHGHRPPGRTHRGRNAHQGPLAWHRVDLAVLLAFAGGSVLFSMLPGPAAALVVQQAAKRGMAGGIGAALGNATTLILHAAAAGVGLAALLAQSASLYQAVRFAGGIYLLGFGAWQLGRTWAKAQGRRAASVGSQRLVNSSAQETVTTASSSVLSPQSTSSKGIGSAYWSAISINLFNPKPPLFFAAFLPQFVATDGSFFAGAVTLGIVAALIDAAWFVVLAGAVVWAGRTVCQLRHTAWLEATGGAAVASFGAAILLRVRG